jgi:hypothetical protein
MTIRTIGLEFWQFLKKPEYGQLVYPLTIRTVLLVFASLLILRMIGVFVEVNSIRPAVVYLTGQEMARQGFPFGTTEFLLSALVAAPLFEETAYRLGLKFDPTLTALSIGLVTFYWLPFGGTYSTSILRVLDEPGFYLMSVVAFITGLTAYALFSIPYLSHSIRKSWERNFGRVFYTAALLFGIMHVFNVREMSWAVVGLAPFITFQQLLFGIFNGFVRVRFGFIQAIIQHALFNLVPVSIYLLGWS